MPLFRFRDPWDYHEYGGYIVEAETVDAATAKMAAMYAAEDARRADGKAPSETTVAARAKVLASITALPDAPYVESGCDC